MKLVFAITPVIDVNQFVQALLFPEQQTADNEDILFHHFHFTRSKSNVESFVISVLQSYIHVHFSPILTVSMTLRYRPNRYHLSTGIRCQVSSYHISYAWQSGFSIIYHSIMYHVSCVIYQVSCLMYHVSCIMYQGSYICIAISCIMYHVSCIVVLCIRYHGSCIR
jgi:hypothetical protein